MNRINLLQEQLAKSLKDIEEAQGKLILESRFGAMGRMTVGVAHEIGKPGLFCHGWTRPD